ncbi:hypothetical protein HYZ78_00090 [Candidatus Microgenomates bacterium]|nr:hypothetical protein [Candidatus Microgenomates bacterium]
MPELPEVETIRRGLEKYLVGKKIVDVDVRLPRIVAGSTQNVVGVKVTAVKRAGKGLIIELSNGYAIAAHIKLTGQFIYRDTRVAQVARVLSAKIGRELPNKWTHVIFNLDKGGALYYNDLRQFGWIKILPTSKVGELPFFKELGPEPPVTGPAPERSRRVTPRVLALSEVEGSPTDTILTLEKFREIVSKSPTKIKPLIMDQKKIGGIGNIYANDALWLAKINPSRSAKTLTSNEQKKLYEAILEVLKRGLKYGGASELTYVNALGGEGEYQKHFLAYAQDGRRCQGCKRETIQKIWLGGRGTYFCPSCQR